ncbi:MAG: hypothetical protein WC080_03950 [Patescibacteria group bacterium]|jgi:hypothetical protein
MRGKLTLILTLLLMVMVGAAFASGINLSEKITNTYPIGRHCPAINGQEAYRLNQYVDAEVWFESEGRFVPGYLIPTETVYAVPAEMGCKDGVQGRWYTITRMVRCGNLARGRFFIPCTPVPPACKLACPERVEVKVPYPVVVEIPKPYPVPYVVYAPAREWVAPAGISPSQPLPDCPVGMARVIEGCTETLLTLFAGMANKEEKVPGTCGDPIPVPTPTPP